MLVSKRGLDLRGLVTNTPFLREGVSVVPDTIMKNFHEMYTDFAWCGNKRCGSYFNKKLVGAHPKSKSGSILTIELFHIPLSRGS